MSADLLRHPYEEIARTHGILPAAILTHMIVVANLVPIKSFSPRTIASGS